MENNESIQNGELTLQNVDMKKLELISKLQQKKNRIRKALKEKGILTNGATNDYDKYEYFSEAQYKELFTDLFSSNGIELIINEVSYGTFDGTEKQPFGRVVTLACTLIDIDTGYSETSNHTGEGLDRGDKAGYKATTGALKRFLSSTFLVATKDDPEREDDNKERNNTQKKSISITPGQTKMIKSIFKNKEDVELLKTELSKLNKKKIEELTVAEASKIIDMKKEK